MWCTRVLHLVYTWCTLGVHVVYTWCTLGVHLVYTWSTLGVQLVCTCFTRGLHVVYTTVRHYLVVKGTFETVSRSEGGRRRNSALGGSQSVDDPAVVAGL